MKNTLNLYTKAKEYQDKRKPILDAYEARMEALEDAKGSKYYTDEEKKAAEARDNALNSLKAEYKPSFSAVLQEMERTNARRAMPAPTAEELRLVQALKLRDYKNMPNLKKEAVAQELQQIAQAVKGNPLCISIIQDVARENGIFANITPSGYNMPNADVMSCLQSISAGLKDFMDYDTSPAARIARETHETRFGKMDETQKREQTAGGLGYSSGYMPLPKRPTFNTPEEFYTSVFNLKGDVYAAFAAAVDD